MMRALPSSVLVAGLLLLATAPAARAQDPLETQPIGAFVVDARGVMPRFKADPTLAEALNVSQANLPTRGLGYAVGGQWFPLRKGRVTFGIGGEMLVSKASRTLEPTTTGGDPGPTTLRDLSVASPIVSLNFGKRQGWSYISGGVGYATLTAERKIAERPADIILIGTPLVESRPHPLTITYGGGARWFVSRHFAVTLDLRFYRIKAQAPGVTRPGVPATTLMVLSAGTAFK